MQNVDSNNNATKKNHLSFPRTHSSPYAVRFFEYISTGRIFKPMADKQIGIKYMEIARLGCIHIETYIKIKFFFGRKWNGKEKRVKKNTTKFTMRCAEFRSLSGFAYISINITYEIVMHRSIFSLKNSREIHAVPTHPTRLKTEKWEPESG